MLEDDKQALHSQSMADRPGKREQSPPLVEILEWTAISVTITKMSNHYQDVRLLMFDKNR